MDDEWWILNLVNVGLESTSSSLPGREDSDVDSNGVER